MKRDVARWIRIPSLLGLLGALSLPAPVRAADQAVAIVVDRDNPQSDIGLEDLRSLFLGKRREWPDGTRAVPIDLEFSVARDAFCATVLRMRKGDVQRYWVDQRIRGAGSAPRVAPSAASVIRLVARVRGAVGYVPLAQVDGSVKILTVGGVAPGKPGYPLLGQLDLVEHVPLQFHTGGRGLGRAAASEAALAASAIAPAARDRT